MNCNRTRGKNRGGRALSRVLPLVIWLVALAGVVILYIHRTTSFYVVGVAAPQMRSITAMESGVLYSLPVQLYQEVKKGQTLAALRMNTASENDFARALLETQKATALAELDRLKAEYLAAEQQIRTSVSQQETDLALRERQLLLDVERIRVSILEIRASLEPEKIQLHELELEKNILQELLNKQAVEAYELQKAEVQYQALAEKVRVEEQWLAQAQEDLMKAQARLDDFLALRGPAPTIQTLLDPLRKAISVQEKRLAELFLPSPEIVITAPFDGIISAVSCSQGQTLLQGQEILSITAARPDHVLVWLDQDLCAGLSPQQEVQVIKTTTPRQIMNSQISQIGPMVELIPERLWKNPSVPEWGRPVMIPIHPEMQLIPNEQVGIRGI